MKESSHNHKNAQMNEIIWNLISAIKNLNRDAKDRLAGQEAF
jgi:hypothetical protein